MSKKFGPRKEWEHIQSRTVKVSAGDAIATRWHTILGRDFIATNGPKVDPNTPRLEPKCLRMHCKECTHVTSSTTGHEWRIKTHDKRFTEWFTWLVSQLGQAHMIHHGEVHALRPRPGHGFSPWSMASAKVLFRHRFKCSKFKIEVQKAKEKVRQTTRQTGSNTYPPKLEKRSLQTGKTFFFSDRSFGQMSLSQKFHSSTSWPPNPISHGIIRHASQ